MKKNLLRKSSTVVFPNLHLQLITSYWWNPFFGCLNPAVRKPNKRY